MTIRIRSIASYVPEKVLTNDEIGKFLDTGDAWIFPRTGIHERHIAAADENVSDMACQAARKALDRAGVSPREIGGLIQTSTSPECLFPATGALIQHKLGMPPVFAFDLQAACSGLIYSLETARCFMKGNPGIRYLLVTASEKMSSVVDWSKRETCILFGDGASAVLLENDASSSEPDSLSPAYLGADGQYFESLLMPAGGSREITTKELLDAHKNFLSMDGRLIFKLAVSGMAECASAVLTQEGMTVSDVDWFVPHQANVRIVNAAAERLGCPADRVFRNVEHYGNTCAATIGIALSDMQDQGLLKSGQKILLSAVGAGLSKGAMLIRM